jgi:hypothetical protein
MEKRQLGLTGQAVALTVIENTASTAKVAILIFFAVGLLLADPARATTVHAKYTIFYLGLPVGNMETRKTFGVSTYQSSVVARVAGIATIVSNFKMT